MKLGRIRIFAAALFLVSLALAARAEMPFFFETTPGRLPKTAAPRRYVIRIEPDFEKFTTKGSETIDIEVLKPTRELVLNALDMDVTNVTLTGSSADKYVVTNKLDLDKQLLTLSLTNELSRGDYHLHLEFSGHIRDRAQGLFYVKYSTPTGRKVMLGTQMEPSDARRFFPCWDEPVFRATYQLNVVVPNNHLPVSNMPIEQETALTNNLKEVSFKPTPSMSSYLVVFVTGELEELEGEAEGVKIRIITTEGKREQGRYALESTKKILGYYNHYFGVKYPLPKLDQIAVPGGFSGAMENWGGITYNERLLLFDPQTSSEETRQGVFGVMAHEMAHQWFGDLVTTAWWDNLWLNEGFASWMGTKCTDHFNPQWEVWLNAGAVKTAVMSDDSRSTTHPVLQPIKNESQANDAFDQITYRKGQSLLRMFESYLGEDTFRLGIQKYISSHRYSNTTTADLWLALAEVSGKPIQAIASGWTEQPGVPVIKVKAACEDGKLLVNFEQERFTVHDANAKPLDWFIPISYADITKPKTHRVELLAQKSLTVSLPDCAGVVDANAGDTGYYRVEYDPPLLAKLVGRINSLPAPERLNLLNDSWAMVQAGRSYATNYLNVVAGLRDEKTSAIWGQVIGRLDLIDGLEQGKTGRAPFREFACALLRPQLERLGWNPKAREPATDTFLRTDVIEALGMFGDQAVIAEARARFGQFLKTPDSLPGNLRGPVIGLVGRYADDAAYEQLHELAKNAKGTEERQLFYRSMAAALDPDLAKKTLALSLTDETVPQEATRLVSEVAQSGEQPELALGFAKEHLIQLLGKVEEFRRNGFLPAIFAPFSDKAHADELESYTKEHVSKDALTKAKETAAGIRVRAAIKDHELPSIDQWIGEHAGTVNKSIL